MAADDNQRQVQKRDSPRSSDARRPFHHRQLPVPGWGCCHRACARALQRHTSRDLLSCQIPRLPPRLHCRTSRRSPVHASVQSLRLNFRRIESLLKFDTNFDEVEESRAAVCNQALVWTSSSPSSCGAGYLDLLEMTRRPRLIYKIDA